KTQVEALKERLTAASNEVKIAEDRREVERVALKAATKELEEERGRVENLGRRVGELEQHLAAQTTEAEILGRRAHDLETRLTEQAKLLTQSEFELKQLHGELDRTRDERDRLARDLAAMKRETEEAWASERVENALLRERINDVAAEVARLASALEGPNSPIDAILAAETVRDRSASAEAKHADAGASNGDLADRIRALQTAASRVPHSDKPQRSEEHTSELQSRQYIVCR